MAGSMTAPIGYCGTVGELLDKIISLDLYSGDRLYISGDDYGNGASLLTEQYDVILES